MNLLGAILYDPAAAVTKSTAALLAMTNFDTTHLRLTVTVPSHGMVRFRMRCAATGATTLGSILLGVRTGSTVQGRIIPAWFPGTLSGATVTGYYDAEFTVTGLTPGSTNFDAAYAVQVVVAATNISYGGPNNNSGNNAWGGFLFEAWDPQPLQPNGQVVVDANGRLDISAVSGTSQTARDLGAQLDATVSSRMATFTLPANFSSLAITAGGAVTAGTVSDKTGYSLTQAFPANFATLAIDGSGRMDVGKTLGQAVTLDANNVINVSTKYVAGTAQTAVDIASRLDVAVSTRLAAGSYTAPDNASIAAIKAKTDSLNFTVPGYADVNIRYVNSIAVNGSGTNRDPWGP
jgi:hypothetical protein